jgi:hypothetical protein
MKNPRALLLTLTTGIAAVTVVLTPVFAEQFFGVITSVGLDENGVVKEVVLLSPKKKAAEVKIKITPSTEIVTGRGDKTSPEALKDAVTNAHGAGKKGAFAKVIHENNVASKITVGVAPAKPAK